MAKNSRIWAIVIVVFLLPSFLKSQSIINSGQIHGSFQLDAQYYIEDSLIGAPKVPEKVLMNGFANLLYTNGDFSAGVRFESYQNVMQGFDSRNKGNGIPYRFASYKSDEFQITIGNIYDQFGNGLIFRTYQDWNLGLDNSLDGIRVLYNPYKGITIKGLVGNQRFFFEKGPGVVRGTDAELALNEIFDKWAEKKTKITIGGSFVSKFQKDQDPLYNLPENVGAMAGRATLVTGKFNFSTEYANKINDPSALNNYIYKNGEAFYFSSSFSQKGLGISLTAKRIDNMNFRSDRSMTGNPLIINYLPALTKQHTYSLAAMYPYNTQPNGEMGIQGEIIYAVKKNTKLGGKYGMDISVNYSRAQSIDLQQVNDTTPLMESGTLGYTSDFFTPGKRIYYEDFNFEISRKFSKKVKAVFEYAYQTYDKEIIEGHPGASTVYAHIGILDFSYKFKEKKNLQIELQHLYTKQDKGNWAMAVAELTVAPSWFFAAGDQWNYGNDDSKQRIHYYTFSMGYIKNTNRISLTYGKQRQGILCVGGVCRNVPAANGFTLTLISSF